jgi:hypothetical protein
MLVQGVADLSHSVVEISLRRRRGSRAAGTGARAYLGPRVA